MMDRWREAWAGSGSSQLYQRGLHKLKVSKNMSEERAFCKIGLLKKLRIMFALICLRCNSGATSVLSVKLAMHLCRI